MDEHGFRVVAGTGWGILHKEEGLRPETEKDLPRDRRDPRRRRRRVHGAPAAMYRDERPWEFTDDRELTGEAWRRYVENANELGRIMSRTTA